MEFAKINNIKDIEHLLDRADVIQVNFKDEGLINADYVITAGGLFEDKAGREIRGIMFDTESGDIVSRPLHKFFNLGEGRCDVSLDEFENLTDYRIFPKLDGSMIAISKHKGDLLIKTRGTIHSKQAQDARQWLIDTNQYETLLNAIDGNFTYIFEWVSPDNTVVVYYEESDLVLLAVRDNITGEYQPKDYLDYFHETTGFSVIEECKDLDIKDLPHLMETETGREGYVIVTGDNRFFKMKNKWYTSLHRSISYMRERDIVASFLEGSLDDLKGQLAQNGYSLERISALEFEVSSRINLIYQEVQKNLEDFDFNNPDYKTLALSIENKDILPLVMAGARGKEIDVVEYFRKKFLKEYPLTTIPLIKGGVGKNE